ncbi:MAG: metallophosphoesterase, partial [Nonomuraea sp.]|nr:metallophosphoesterase [Nonomuraea sp.]
AGTRMELGSWLAWPGYLWVALMFYLVVFLIVLEVPRAVASVLIRRSERRRAVAKEPVPVLAGAAAPPAVEPVAAPPMSRRLFLGRTTAVVAGVSALGTVGYGVSSALGDPVIEPVRVRLAKLDPRLNGLRFAVVSDIHLGPLTGVGHTERIVRMINGLQADVVAIVGDLVDGSVAELGALAKPLKSLESRYGAYFVTGNHEYYTANGPQEWIEELDQLGVRSLRNERVEIRHQGGVLDLAGVNDLNGEAVGDGPDFGKALGGRDPGRSTVLLAHQPVQVDQAAGFGVDLQLSGHTHGGQIMPFNLVVGLQQPVVSGLATVDGVQVYVTRGAGFWGPPVRVGAPPEITMLELRS